MTTDVEIPELFRRVVDVIDDAVLVAFDGCHKIYLALDDYEADWFRQYFDYTVQDTPEVMLNSVIEWYEDSCPLRFVSSVRRNHDDPSAGFTTLIAQFEDVEDE